MTIPTLDPTIAAAQPFTIQVERGEAEAYGCTLITALGNRHYRISRDGPIWYCHPHNEHRNGSLTGIAGNPQDAVFDALNRVNREAEGL